MHALEQDPRVDRMTCPLCSAPLNVLRGPDGYAVDVVPQSSYPLRGTKLAERRRLAAIVTCSACEYVLIDAS